MLQTLKRLHVEMKTLLSPQSTRVRVKEPELHFTLFDETEVAEMESSAFDGQLSDLSDLSDTESDLLPLAVSRASSDVGDNEDMQTSKKLLGDWTGIRKAKNGYRLPSIHENLSGPDLEGFKFQIDKLDDITKEIIKKFCDYLIRNWPSRQLNFELARSRHFAFADPTAFWHALFQPEFKKYLDFLAGVDVGNQSERVCFLLNSLSIHTYLTHCFSSLLMLDTNSSIV